MCAGLEMFLLEILGLKADSKELSGGGQDRKKGEDNGPVECDVLNESEQLVARASSTYMAISGAQANNRTLPKELLA